MIKIACWWVWCPTHKPRDYAALLSGKRNLRGSPSNEEWIVNIPNWESDALGVWIIVWRSVVSFRLSPSPRKGWEPNRARILSHHKTLFASQIIWECESDYLGMQTQLGVKLRAKLNILFGNRGLIEQKIPSKAQYWRGTYSKHVL